MLQSLSTRESREVHSDSSGALFSPSIVAALGTFTAPQSLLLSTPPYVLTFIATLGTAWLSDKWKKRGIFNLFWSVIAGIGYILLIAIPIQYPGPRYFAVFLTVMSTGPLIACTISWTGELYIYIADLRRHVGRTLQKSYRYGSGLLRG